MNRTSNHASDRTFANQSKESAGWLVGVLVPIAFVLCWATGFVVPRAFEGYSEPLTFVLLRNAGALVVLLIIAFALRRPWPGTRSEYAGLLWSGALLQGFSLAFMYGAIYHGVPAGIAALIGGLQPAITAMLAAWLAGEALSAVQWLGIAIGFAGVALVVSPKLGLSPADLSPGLLLICLLGVASIAYGTIYQKRFEQTADAWTRTTVMFVGALIPPVLGAALFERGEIVWAPMLVAVYVWSVLALAIGATMALLFLIQRGQAAPATSLIYLVPPVSAAIAYLGFGETVGAVQITGFVVAALGLLLVQKAARKR